MLTPLLAQLRDVAPGIEIEVIAANDLRDLQRREADIAIRHIRPVQPELIGRQVGQWSAHLYAAQGFLDKHGRPGGPADLAALDFVGFAPIERLVQTMVTFGLPLTRRNFRYVTDNGIVMAEMLRRGLGVGVTPKEFAHFLPELEMVLPDWKGIPVPLWLICHKELLTSRRIRIVYDFLAEALAGGG